MMAGLLAPALHAADLSVSVRTAKGAPVADAVVTVAPHEASGAAPAREHAPVTKVIDQKNETFIPYVETFRPGDSVVFRNSDQTRHHVYSFAPARQFEFVLTPGQSSSPLRLEQVGPIAVGCNIHDHMITYLFVADTPWIEQSGADGNVHVANLPPGDYDVSVWHPQLRPGQAPPMQTLHVADADTRKDLSFSLTLLPDPRRRADRERVDY